VPRNGAVDFPVSQLSRTRAESARNFSRPPSRPAAHRNPAGFSRVFLASCVPRRSNFSGVRSAILPVQRSRTACRCGHDCVRQEKSFNQFGDAGLFCPASCARRKAIPCSNANGCVERSCHKLAIVGFHVKSRRYKTRMVLTTVFTMNLLGAPASAGQLEPKTGTRRRDASAPRNSPIRKAAAGRCRMASGKR